MRGVVLAALAAGVAAGAWEGALAALRPFDPLLRVLARSRLRAAFVTAGRMTAVQRIDHVLRIGFLLEAKRMADADLDDVAAIEREYAETVGRTRAPRTGPLWTAALVSALVVAIAAAVASPILLRPFDPRRSAAGRVLSSDVPAFVVALSQNRQTARAEDIAARARGPLGERASRALGELLEATTTLAARPADDQGRAAAQERYVTAAAAFNHALEAADQPWFVDAESLTSAQGTTAVLMTFYVQREVKVRSGETSVRVVQLRRADDIALEMPFLGYTRPSTPAAVVLLDKIETDLIRFVLPALPEGERLEMVDEETRITGVDWAELLEKRGGEVVRRHYADRLPAGAARVGQLLARRRALVMKWRREIAGLGLILRVPERLTPEADYSNELRLRVPSTELYEWDALHDELQEPELLAAFGELRARYVASVERHEVQHRLDYARELIPVPDLLGTRLGVDNPLAAPQGSLPARARDELSAYLASLAMPDGSPLLELCLQMRALFDATRVDAYSYSALATLEGIARELGIDPAAVLGQGRVRRERAAELFHAVSTRSAEDLRAAAARVFKSAYGQDVPTVAVESAKTNREWRP